MNLRNGEAGNGEARDEVRAEKGKIVVWGPVENGEEILKCEEELFEASLVLETVERVIREEDFRDSLSEFVECGSVWWQLHCMDLHCLVLDFDGAFMAIKVFHSVGVHTHLYSLVFPLSAVSLKTQPQR